MAGTKWQSEPVGTPAPEDTLLFRDVSDNAANSAGKVKQATIADLLALLGSTGAGGGGGGSGGGGGTGEFTAVGDFIETTDTSFTWTPAAAGNILVVIADSTESGNPVTAASSETAAWARVVSGVKAGSFTVTAETAFVGTSAGVTEETVTLTTAAAPGNLRVLAHEFSTGGVPVSLATFVTMDGDSDGDSVSAWPAIAGTGLVFGYERNFGDGDGAAAAGTTAGVSYYVDANTNGGAYAIIDGSVTVGWADTDSRTVLVLLLALGSGGGGGGGSGGGDLVVVPAAADQVSSSAGVAHSVTAFSPPAGSMVRVAATWLDATDQLGKTFTCKDSLNNSYTATLAGTDDGGCYMLFFDCQYSTPPGSITVTVTAAGTGATATADCLIQPYVITGQASDQSAAASDTVNGSSSVSTCEISLTTTEAGSIVFVAGAPNNAGHPVPSPIAGTVTDSEWDDDDVGSHGVIGRSPSPTVTPGSKTYGWTLSAASVFGFGCIAAEVLPASSGGGGGGGGTPAGVPQAPLLGTYPGDDFPTPGPSAWPSGAQTNIAAQYFAWDDTASDVASFIGKCKANGLTPFVELEPWHFDQSAVLFSSITSGGSDSFLAGIGSAIASAGIPVILTFAHEFNVSGQYPWSQGMSGSGPGGGNLSSTNWKLGWNYVRTKVNSTANGLALWMWGSSAWTGGTTIDPSPWWPSPVPDMVGIDGYPDTEFGATLGTFNGQIKPTVTAIRGLGWDGDIFIAETNLREMVDSGGESITNFVADMAANGISGILEFEDPSWGLSPMTSAQWTEYHNAVAANYGS